MEVYFKTSEVAGNVTTQKYYKDIVDKEILLMQSVKTGVTIYYIAPDFIKRYNDFSNDTVLFYGGFCYSFLGTWPLLVDACASGTYFGFDWIARAGKCANWAVDLVDKMSEPGLIQLSLPSSSTPRVILIFLKSLQVKCLPMEKC